MVAALVLRVLCRVLYAPYSSQSQNKPLQDATAISISNSSTARLSLYRPDDRRPRSQNAPPECRIATTGERDGEPESLVVFLVSTSMSGS
jgi:hypothetical protein